MANFVESYKQVSSRILENWGMLLIDLSKDAKSQFDMDRSFFCATTNFSGRGTDSGSYSIMCQEDLLAIIARNLIGSEDAIPHEQRMDALKEMSNVLAGNLITAFYGDAPTFDLTPPTAFEMPVELAMIVLDSNRTLAMMADGFPVAISFSIDNPDLDI